MNPQSSCGKLLYGTSKDEHDIIGHITVKHGGKYLIKGYKKDDSKRTYFELEAISLPVHIQDTSFPIIEKHNEDHD